MRRSHAFIKAAFIASLSVIFAIRVCAVEPVRVCVADFGAKPGSRENAAPAVQKALAACKANESSLLVFPKGRYDFYAPENGARTNGINIHNLRNITIDGGGSEFVFHGVIGAASVYRSENISFRNFTIDWDKPFIVQGIIVETRDTWLDVKFDTAQYPFEIEDGKIRFTGEGWKRQIDGYTLLFDKDTKEIVYKTNDYPFGHFDAMFNAKAEALGDGVVRFHGRPRYKAEPGAILALWLGRYMIPGIAMHEAKNVSLANIEIHHALSHGVTAFRSENITLTNVNLRANEKKGRVFSTVADGFHISTCKGLLKIENCTHTGLGDDFLNVHGMHVLIRRVIDGRTIEAGASGKAGHSGTLAAGDEVWFVDAAAMRRGKTNTIREIKKIPGDTAAGKPPVQHIIFENPLPAGVGKDDLIENKTWNPELELRNCNILKRHRARGILVTTPRRAVIENNYFRTAGTAILIEGDANYWYESGACTDVVIRNNVFEDCFTSGNGNAWGRAVITIHPSFEPRGENDDAYHRNIRIENNTFKAFDYPLLYARSVRDLKFAGNALVRSRAFEPYAGTKATFTLDGCRDAVIAGNSYSGDFPGKNARLLHMKRADLQLGDKEIAVEIDGPTGKQRDK